MTEERLKHALDRERELRRSWQRNAQRLTSQLQDVEASLVARLEALEARPLAMPLDRLLEGVAAIRRDVAADLAILRSEVTDLATAVEQLRSIVRDG